MIESDQVAPRAKTLDAIRSVLEGEGIRFIGDADADRALCYDLSLRYDIVSSGRADLTVRSVVTRVDLTNVPASGARLLHRARGGEGRPDAGDP